MVFFLHTEAISLYCFPTFMTFFLSFIKLFIFKTPLFLDLYTYSLKINNLRFWSIFKLCNSLKKQKRGTCRSSYPEVFLEKGVLKICRKFTREHPCRSAISIKLVAKQLYWNHTLAWVFSCRFAAYFQNTFF